MIEQEKQKLRIVLREIGLFGNSEDRWYTLGNVLSVILLPNWVSFCKYVYKPIDNSFNMRVL